MVKFDSHMWVGDTLDGGISDWLHELDEWPLVRWEKGKGSSERLPPGPITRSREGGRRRWTGDERLQAKCQCGGVEFSISPPNDESSNASSPWSDLLVPYHTAPPDNPDDVKWWLRDEGTRYLAGTCACASCRLASGFDIQAWAFIPKVNILHVDGRPFDFRTETLEQHESSNSTVREFCRVCGATVFWRREDRAELIDVSVGLLRTESGVRAEEWLDWCVGRVSFAEEGLNQKLIQALTKGLEAWREGVPPSI